MCMNVQRFCGVLFGFHFNLVKCRVKNVSMYQSIKFLCAVRVDSIRDVLCYVVYQRKYDLVSFAPFSQSILSRRSHFFTHSYTCNDIFVCKHIKPHDWNHKQIHLCTETIRVLHVNDAWVQQTPIKTHKQTHTRARAWEEGRKGERVCCSGWSALSCGVIRFGFCQSSKKWKNCLWEDKFSDYMWWENYLQSHIWVWKNSGSNFFKNKMWANKSHNMIYGDLEYNFDSLILITPWPLLPHGTIHAFPFHITTTNNDIECDSSYVTKGTQ